MLTAAQCASYDESKKLWLRIVGGGEDFTTHLGASMITGVITTTATGPVDVIKTNMFVGECPWWRTQRAPQRCHHHHSRLSLWWGLADPSDL